MQLFHPSYIRSHRYNYTVDYFELRAQTGRYGYIGGGDSNWSEDIPGILIHPINLSNAIVIGGTSRRSDEMLRVVGDIDVGGIRIGDSYIRETLDGLVFFDPILNNEISLSSIIGQYWTRDSVNHWLLPKNTIDSLLLGQSTGDALKRLQITSEADNGSSHLIFGKNSSAVDIFSVSDQGNVFLKGNLIFNATEYISRSSTYLNFVVEDLSGLKIYKDKIEGSAFLVKSTNPFYSRVGYPTDGIGFPTNNEVAVYTNNINALNVSATQLTFPKNNWIFSGKNLLRVRTDGIIDLGTFSFDDVNKIFYMTADLFISKDVAGNMIFDDEFAGPVSLTQLLSSSSSYWDRSVGGVLYPRIPTDIIKIPSFAGIGTRAVFIATDGTLVSGTFEPPVDLYNNLTPMPQAVGGLAAGTTFADRTMTQVFNDMLYIYQVPAFTAFTVTGFATIIEAGVDFTGGIQLFTWSISNPGNVVAGSVAIRDITNDVDILINLVNDGSENYELIAGTRTTTGQTRQWGIRATDTKTNQIGYRYLTTYFYSPFYYGVGAAALIVSSLQALTKSISARGSKSISFTAVDQKFYFAYPSSYGALSSIIDQNAYNITSAFTMRQETFVNNPPNYNGISVLYNVYESNEIGTMGPYVITFNF